MERRDDTRFDQHEREIEEPSAQPDEAADDLPVGPSPSSPDLRRQIEDDLERQQAGGATPPLREEYGGPRTASDGTRVEPDASEGDARFDESER
jgi:hypothetical protein